MALRSVQSWKTTWWKNMSDSGGAQDHMLSLMKPEEFPFASHTKKEGRMWGSMKRAQYLKLLEKNRGLYEIIESAKKRKVYFDVDCPGDAPDPIETVKTVLTEKFPGARLQISGSRTPIKISYHVIISNWFFMNKDLQRSMLSWTIMNVPHVDKGVYTMNRNMKCVNQGKTDGRVQTILEGSPEILKHMILDGFDDDAQDASEITWELCSTVDRTRTFDILEIPELNLTCPEDFDWIDSTPVEVLNLIQNTPDLLGHMNTWKIMLWAKTNNVTFEQFWTWCRQADDTLVRIKEYQKSWIRGGESPGIWFIKRLLARMYPGILKDRTVKKFLKSQEEPIGTPSRAKFLTRDDLGAPEKFVLLTGPMGTNKTGAVIDVLDPKERILWITPRISLSHNLHQRLRATNKFKFQNYKDFEKAHEDQIGQARHLICCVPSLYKTDKAVYDTVVLDEIETLLMMWRGDLGHMHFDINWMKFKEVIAAAKKVYVMDAFMGAKTTNFLKGPFKVINGFQRPDERRMIPYTCEPSWTATIAADLARGQKVFVFYPYKMGNTKYCSMEKFVKVLITASGVPENEFICYNSDSPDSIKKTLQDVNRVWASKSCIVCNTCITVGVNFDELHFDKIYAMWQPFVSQRDFFQNMYRCRKLRTNEVHLFTEKPRRTFNPWIHSDNKDQEYKSLIRDITLEENSKGSMDVFKLFAHQSGFVFHGCAEEVSVAIKERIMEIVKETDCIFKWGRIPMMTFEQYEQGKHAIINSYTSRIDTVAGVHKYDFAKMFRDGTPDAILEYLWDAHKFKLFDAIRSQELEGLRPADIIIRDLFEQNKCRYFLPEDPKWTYSLEKVRAVFDTRCGGEEHRYNQELMSSVLEAYFGMKVWVSTKELKWDGKRRYRVFEVDPDFEYLVSNFLRFMDRRGVLHVPKVESHVSCFISDEL